MNPKLLPLTLLPILLTSCDFLNPNGLKTAMPGNYDLYAESVTYSPTNVTVGTPVVFDKVVRNLGADPIKGGTYNVDFFLDGKNISFDHDTSTIDPGKEVSYSMAKGYHHFMPQKPGIYHYRFIVDKENNLPETDESNNIITGTIVVK